MSSPDSRRALLHRIVPGLTGTAEIVVGPEHTAPFVGSGRIAVLATPVMINLIEAAALAAVEHLLPTGHQSLGIQLDVSHTAATPIGLRATTGASSSACRGSMNAYSASWRRKIAGPAKPPAQAAMATIR